MTKGCTDDKRAKKAAYDKARNEANKDKRREYRKVHSTRILEYLREYRKANKEKTREYKKMRCNSDPLYKLQNNIRKRLTNFLGSKKTYKNGGFFKIVGCTVEELRSFLESKFTTGMTWENYGDWHIDHFIPLSVAQTQEEAVMLSHYSNLQPMWGVENLAKSDSLPDNYPPNFPFWEHFLYLFEQAA